ncbi:MAG: radical SAM family heme chaperone HemW [Kofleriaceae bacterium]|nr:radical SAM family heme chaperone HemW [Kofleriaceae bacterium]
MNKPHRGQRLGVYVHFPWCRRLCPYCDFAVEVVPKEPPHTAYRDEILVELEARAEPFAGPPLVSIYFGGGTPSRWRPDCLADVVTRIAQRFAAAPASLEITLEANPIDCTAVQLDAWAAAGINRISIGVQSLTATELTRLGRDHRMGDGLAAVELVARDGRFIVSCDIIFGTPSGGVPVAPESWVPILTALPLQHLSVYELTIEARTVFGKQAQLGKLRTYDEDVLADLYTRTHDLLTDQGFEHYEISSYARPGYQALHNSLYWTGDDFLGLGVGAASFRTLADGSAQRSTNPRRYQQYTQTPRVLDVMHSTANQRAADLLWLGLRTTVGVSQRDLARCAGLEAILVAQGLVRCVGDRVIPTLRGFLLADYVAGRIVQAAPADP